MASDMHILWERVPLAEREKVTWTLAPAPSLGPSYELLKVECTVHPWSWASYEHGRAADAARDHLVFHHSGRV